MTGWAKVRWTQARQITRLMGMKDADAPAETIAPLAWFESLCDSGDAAQAVRFLGHALPRFEGVAWATDVLASIPATRGPADAEAFAAIRRWVADPDDARRRAAYEAAEQADDDAPERILGYAVFMSGGSIAPPDQTAVNPAPELSGRLAAAAVLTAALRAPDAATHLAEALAAGDAIARGGD